MVELTLQILALEAVSLLISPGHQLATQRYVRHISARMTRQIHFLTIEPDFNGGSTAQHNAERRFATILAARSGAQQIHIQVLTGCIQDFYPGIRRSYYFQVLFPIYER